jgi:hypothetical protein
VRASSGCLSRLAYGGPGGGESERERVVPEVATWSCPTCRRDIATAFCPRCGETAVDGRDLTSRGLARQAFETFVAVDGKLMRSFRMLLLRPGELSLAYVRGQRVAFTGPFRVFLFANMLFFAAQSLTDASVVGTSLQSHLHEQDWSGIAQRLVARRLVALRTTLELYGPAFDHAVVLNAKSLIILMVLPFTGALALTFLPARRPFVAHAVFALHFYAFLMLVLCALLFAEGASAWLGGVETSGLDKPLFALLLAGSTVYLYLATGVAYEARGWTHGAKAVMLTLVVGAMISVYRFAIFLITLYTTA